MADVTGMQALLAEGIAARVEPLRQQPTGACGGAAAVVVAESGCAGAVRVDGGWHAFEFVRRGWRTRSVMAAPHMVESTLERDGRTLKERILVPPGSGLVLVQWLGAGGPKGIGIRLDASSALEVGTSGPDGEPRLHPAGASTDGRGNVDVGSRVAGLVVAVPGAGDAARALRRASARAAGLAATLRRAPERGPRIEADALQAVLHRGRGALSLLSIPDAGAGELAALTAEGMRPVTEPVAIRAALAALALGDHGPAAMLLDRLAANAALGTGAREREQRALERGAASAAGVLLLFGMFVGWTGDLTGAARWRNLLLRAARYGARESADSPPAGPAVAVALAAAEAAADAELIDALRQGPDARAQDPAGALLSTLAAYPAAGFRWPLLAAPAGANREILAAADAVLSIIHGRLGVEPDAPRGRLRLRVDLTGGGISARGIRAGDAGLDVEATIDARRGGDLDAAPARGTARLRVQPAAGAAPLQLLLEPLLPANRLVRARVDGVDAGLSPVHVRPGVLRIPVQVAADAVRTLEFELA